MPGKQCQLLIVLRIFVEICTSNCLYPSAIRSVKKYLNISNEILHRVEHYLKRDGPMEQSRT